MLEVMNRIGLDFARTKDIDHSRALGFLLLLLGTLLGDNIAETEGSKYEAEELHRSAFTSNQLSSWLNHSLLRK